VVLVCALFAQDSVNVLREGNRSGHVVAVCCSVLQCVAVCVHTPRCASGRGNTDDHSCCSVLQCVAVCCSVLQCVAARGHMTTSMHSVLGNGTRNTHNTQVILIIRSAVGNDDNVYVYMCM